MSSDAVNAPTRRENPDPTEGAGAMPKWFLAFAFALVAAGGVYLYLEVPKDGAGFAGDSRTVQMAPPEVTGASLYAVQCVACHQQTGLGVSGVFPPLGGSSWVTEDPETPVRILLFGIQGAIEVEGEIYNGQMPAFGHLSDEDIAKLVSHIRTSYGNDAGEVEPALVTQLRAELSDRDGPWQGGGELSAARE